MLDPRLRCVWHAKQPVVLDTGHQVSLVDALAGSRRRRRLEQVQIGMPEEIVPIPLLKSIGAAVGQGHRAPRPGRPPGSGSGRTLLRPSSPAPARRPWGRARSAAWRAPPRSAPVPPRAPEARPARPRDFAARPSSQAYRPSAEASCAQVGPTSVESDAKRREARGGSRRVGSSAPVPERSLFSVAGSGCEEGRGPRDPLEGQTSVLGPPRSTERVLSPPAELLRVRRPTWPLRAPRRPRASVPLTGGSASPPTTCTAGPINGRSRPGQPGQVRDLELGADLISLQEVLRPDNRDDPLEALAEADSVAFAVTRVHKRSEINEFSRVDDAGVTMLDLSTRSRSGWPSRPAQGERRRARRRRHPPGAHGSHASCR